MVIEQVRCRKPYERNDECTSERQRQEDQDEAIGDKPCHQHNRPQNSIVQHVHESIEITEQGVYDVWFVLVGAIAHD